MKSLSLSTGRWPAMRSISRTRVFSGLLPTLLLICTSPATAQDTPVQFKVLRSFGFPETSASQPATWLTEARDGALYGVAGTGLFRVNKDGTGFVVLYPIGGNRLLEGSDGKLYTGGMGGILKINPDGSGWQDLHHFSNVAGQPRDAGPFIEASDGMLYAPANGGSLAAGCIVRINKDGTGFSVLHSFGAVTPTGEPTSPGGRLLEASDGWLYGTTFYGGSFNRGTIYRIRKDGTGFIKLVDFGSDNNGEYPIGGLIEGGDGFIYGATKFGGGSPKEGTIFRIRESGAGWSLTVLFRFDVFQMEGIRPEGLILGRDGVLYGTCGQGGDRNYSVGTAFRLNRDGTGFALLHAFGFSPTNAGPPVGGVIEGSDGKLYGAGATGGSAVWGGAIYGLTPNGREFNLIHSLSASGGDGQNPSSPLLEGPDGSHYGVTAEGGTNGGGTVFKYEAANQRYTILHHFGRSPPAPFAPLGSLARDSQNRLFGVTADGFQSPRGAIFQLGTDGSNFTVLHKFGGPPTDGELHDGGGLMLASDNRLYGTTLLGGTQWFGTVFRIDTSGSNYTILRHFRWDDDGARYPYGQLLEGSDGALYGGTMGFGSYSNHSCIFRINKDGSDYRVLHVFEKVPGDGQIVNAYLTEGRDGFLYGATRAGGSLNQGTVFRLRKDGADYSILSDSLPGARPVGGVIEGSDGALYGITSDNPQDNDDDDVGPCIYRLSKTGVAERLHNLSVFDFRYNTFESVRLIEAKDGNLYGTSGGAGALGIGTIYRVTAPSLTRVSLVRGIGGVFQVRWQSILGVTYRVQHKARLEDASWIDLPGDVTGSGDIEFKSDLPDDVSRFYRVATVQ